jgi:hypothetical protein
VADIGDGLWWMLGGIGAGLLMSGLWLTDGTPGLWLLDRIRPRPDRRPPLGWRFEYGIRHPDGTVEICSSRASQLNDPSWVSGWTETVVRIRYSDGRVTNWVRDYTNLTQGGD